MTLKLKYSKNIVGCRMGDEIFVHPELRKEKKLYKAVLKHESEHSDGYGFKDFVLDMFNEELKGHKGAYYRFMLKHPRTMLGLLPICKIGPYWAIDATMTAFTILLIGIIVLLSGGVA